MQLMEQEAQQIVGGMITAHVIKSVNTLAIIYTSLAQILNHRYMNVIEATDYYKQLGHSIGEILYKELHSEECRGTQRKLEC